MEVTTTDFRAKNDLDGSQSGWFPSAVQDIESISLAEVAEGKTQLLNRVESKYLMTVGQCKRLIQAISDSYRVLEVRDVKIGRYETRYYDDNSFTSYIQHHNGKGNRYKLRLRHYETSGETYLEVKKKSNKGSTEKQRIKTSWPPAEFLPEEERFLEATFPYDCREFHPVLRTVYERSTLVSTEFPERITFDTAVQFGNGKRDISYPGLVIGEVKREKSVKNSPAQRALRSMGIQERSFSKYCVGVSLLHGQLKHNRFKPNLRFIARLSQGGRQPC
ncbi:MAG: polyphosphate polymerase domain-containing protein [Methanoculleus sp.]